MSLETWKKEFLSIENPKDVPDNDRARLERDLSKWIGLRPYNLEKHGIVGNFRILSDGQEKYIIDSSSCSLCQKYINGESASCEGCPLYKARNLRCDQGMISPYAEFVDNGNAEPMITLLEKTLSREASSAERITQ